MQCAYLLLECLFLFYLEIFYLAAYSWGFNPKHYLVRQKTNATTAGPLNPEDVEDPSELIKATNDHKPDTGKLVQNVTWN